MSEKTLVIVESPTKARTITKFLGKDYIVKASNGHIRDLPNNAAEVPEALKKTKWAKLGVNVDDNFEPLYIIPENKRDQVRALKDAVKEASVIFLATDEDREGESISWHLVEALKPKVPVKRLVFHEITREAIQSALSSPRTIDENLVRAQETRRIVDRLFGYEVSPLLWKKMAPRLSAGRVQSVAIRLLVEREWERIRFRSAKYWSLKGSFAKNGAPDSTVPFDAELTHVDGVRVAIGKDFDPATGQLKRGESVTLLDAARAAQLKEQVLSSTAKVVSVEEKPYSQSPYPPFVTSTLQQESNIKLRLSAKATMGLAQQLYENGFITYMRTDSTTLSEQALTAARRLIERDFGKEYLPAQPRRYQTKVKNAQEAHEAIRPAGDEFTPPEVVKQQLGYEAFRVYDLIWKRTVASQMENARGTHISVSLEAGPARFRATGKTIEFAGHLRAYVEGSDDPEAELSDRERLLPKLTVEEALRTVGVDGIERSTQAPPRFTEGSIIKELERLGIGRPSTWATIVELVLSRAYAFKKGTALVPTFTAMAVVNLLQLHFTKLLDFEFTARLEDDLDAISRGEAQNIKYLHTFYFGNGHPGLRQLVELGQEKIDPREVCGIPIGAAPDGENIEVRIGRYGPFITNGTVRASVPENTAPDELTIEVATQILATSSKEPEALGNHPDSGEAIYVKNGRFGPYVQLGENQQGEGAKPKMASLLPGMAPTEVTLEIAVKLLGLPRSLGKDPASGEEVVAANGRFGPYVKAGAETRSIPSDGPSVIDIGLEAAIELLKQPKTRGRASSKPKILREVGEHPDSKEKINVLNGRYGPYVTDGTTNASLPRGSDPEKLTLEEALSLIAERAAKAPAPKKGRAKKEKKEPAKKAAAKKEPADKPEKKSGSKSTRSKKSAANPEISA